MTSELQKIKQIYRWAKARCNNPNVKSYSDYGGRGIEFKFTSYGEFLDALGPRPLGYTLDRINNDGHYEPTNVRWTTRQIQNKNKRVYKTNSSGVSGVTYRPDRCVWISRGINECGKRVQLYVGKDFTKACDARWQWERDQSKI